ncbi:MAG: integrase arm-type DNA-binding domain-containing protein [Magnetococcus sp. YQC-9]
MPLTDTAIRNARIPNEKKMLKLTDGDGMYLLVNQAGRYFRFDYAFDGRRKTLALGVYPETGLKQAREKRDEARRLLAEGIDPSEHRKITKSMDKSRATDSFEAIAREWIAKFSPTWADSHTGKIVDRLERDAFPWLGGRPIREIEAPELLECARRVEARGALDTAHRLLQNCGQVFRFAIATGRATRNPVPDLRGALQPAKGGHFAAITDPTAFGQLLRAIDGYPGFISVKSALRLLALLFVRPNEIRGARWVEIDMTEGTWTIPAARMKGGLDHVVPLSRQSLAILREIEPFSGHGEFVFKSVRGQGKAISDMALSVALKSLGYSGDQHTPHGFRATARTLLDETLGFRVEWIEHQLAHAVRDPLGRAYNRTSFLPERRRMMQAWADYLDQLAGRIAKPTTPPPPPSQA